MRSLQSLKTAVLLVGGHSTRMGSDKFLMENNGRTQWEFMVEQLSTFFDEVHLSCRRDQAHHFEGQHLIFDEFENIGPMGAIFSSFRLFESRYPTLKSCFFIACDLPHFDVTLAEVLHAHLPLKYDVVAAQNQERGSPEPLVAFWNSSAMPRIEQCIADENYALFKCMQQLKVKTVEVNDSKALRNVNRPSDL